MKWLNLDTDLRGNASFAQATDAQRGIWLSLSMYCATMENGGRIVGARSWSGRTWIQAVGVEREDVLTESPLWHWSDPAGIDTLIVHEYPIAQQERVKELRKFGKKGGNKRSATKAEKARVNGSLGGRPRLTNGHNPS